MVRATSWRDIHTGGDARAHAGAADRPRPFRERGAQQDPGRYPADAAQQSPLSAQRLPDERKEGLDGEWSNGHGLIPAGFRALTSLLQGDAQVTAGEANLNLNMIAFYKK